jgi:hypothetical protein
VTKKNLNVNIKKMLSNPDYYLWRIGESNKAEFLQMSRDAFSQSIFLDRRIHALSTSTLQLDLEDIYSNHCPKVDPTTKFCYIFHMAHCGSTLLARAMDLINENIVYREPSALRQLGLMASDSYGREPAIDWDNLLNFTLSQLGKAYKNNSPVIIKANVPVNFCIPELLDINNHTRAILLYSNFENYMLSILKADTHRNWLNIISNQLAPSIQHIIGIDKTQLNSLSSPEKAACMWLVQITLFDQAAKKYKQIRCLEAELFFNDSEEVLAHAFKQFGIKAKPSLIKSIASSELFNRHSKNPNYRYDNNHRIQEKERIKAAIPKDLTEAKEWLKPYIDQGMVPQSLSRPLLGEAPKLISNPGWT